MTTPSINLFQLNDSTDTSLSEGLKLSSSEIASKKLAEHFKNLSGRQEISEKSQTTLTKNTSSNKSVEETRKAIEKAKAEVAKLQKEFDALPDDYDDIDGLLGFDINNIGKSFRKAKKYPEKFEKLQEAKDNLRQTLREVKASNGLTFMEAENILVKINNKYRGNLTSMDYDKNGRGTRNEERYKSIMTEADRAAYESACAAQEELEKLYPNIRTHIYSPSYSDIKNSVIVQNQ